MKGDTLVRQPLVGGLVVLLLSSVVAACAPARIGLEPSLRERLTAAPVVHLVAYATDPPPLTTAKAVGAGSLFGAFGGLVAAAHAAETGKGLMARNKVDGLSLLLAKAMADELTDLLPNLRAASEPATGREVEDLRKAGLRPLALDVLSNGHIMYYGSNWARYRLLYNARARVLDTEAGTVLWQGVCDFRGPDDPAQSPTLDEIEAADGVAYRRMIEEATAACVKDLRRQYRGEAT
jgi:ABC-type amino acid transport substrate-binding protein